MGLFSRAMDDATDTITRLQSEIEEIKSDISDKKKSIAQAEEELKGATRQREDENTEFKSNLKDDKDMASVLAKAKAVLKDFYKENDLMLVQRQPEVAEELKAADAHHTGCQVAERAGIEGGIGREKGGGSVRSICVLGKDDNRHESCEQCCWSEQNRGT